MVTAGLLGAVAALDGCTENPQAEVGTATVLAPPPSTNPGPSPSFVISDAGCADATAPDGPDAGRLASDQEIAGVDLELHSREVAAGGIAGARARQDGVRQFAADSVSDHGQAIRRVAFIVQTSALNPEDSALRRQMGQQTAQELNALWAVKGAAFDRAYIDWEVATDTAALDLVTSLVPRTQDAVLWAEFVDQKQQIAQRLQQAQALQEMLAAPIGEAIK